MSIYTVSIIAGAATSMSEHVVGQYYTVDKSYLEVTTIKFYGFEERLLAEFSVADGHSYSIVKNQP